MGYIRVCKECGREFIGTGARSVFCSYECRHAAAMRRQRDYRRTHKGETEAKTYPRVCPICGVAFRAVRVNGVYCSPDCCAEGQRQKAQAKRAAARLAQGKPAEAQKVARPGRSFGGEMKYAICTVCHNSYPADVGRQFGGYCSKACQTIGEAADLRRAERKAAKERRAAQAAKNAPITCEKCARCKLCRWYDVADKTCGFCALNMAARGCPVSETCKRYEPAKGRQRVTRKTRNNAVFAKV